MENPVKQKTILNQTHRDMGARMVPFGGWDMPVHYGSQIKEHHAVRQDAGMFDVCHMTSVDIRGAQARDFLRAILANDVAKLKTTGKALYSCMLRKDGGILDDLIVYFMDDNWYRMVVNAGTTDKDIDWMEQQSQEWDVQILPRRDLGMIAVQGPNAREKALPLLPDDLRDAASKLTPFSAAANDSWFVGRTGYTGEDGFEIILPEDQVVAFWKALADAGIRPCGLGARDTLRLEAGMNLYGSDMDEDSTPLESGLGWTVPLGDLQRDFIGRSALVVQKVTGNVPEFTGILLEGKGVLRHHQKLYDGDREVGEVTSGGFSPTLQRAIGLARIAADAGEDISVDIRGKKLPVKQVKPPFVRNGKSCI
jgi:aminomethyltransferase